ncbi:hypothetical protein DFH06DRAFT_1311448 [Mycena polygramma]|nr:hypothetical protein DFH06DRAFT_1311448 [Mycena polygramma]
MSSNPNRPDLPDSALAIERCTMLGIAISLMVFGIVFSVFLRTMYLLIDEPPRRDERRNLALIAYTFFLFALGTIFVFMDLYSLQLAFVDNRNAPGGPMAYFYSQYGTPISVVPNACSVIGDWLAAGFLLYRCLKIFQLNIAIVAVPILMYISSIGLGIMLLFQASRPNATLWTKTTVNFGIPYYTITAALNVLITAMIATRLLLYRWTLHKVLGTERALTVPYATVASMLVESCVLYAATSILFLVPYGIKNPISNVFIPILIQVQLLAPLLIILRVADRRGWNKDTATLDPTAATSIKFQAQMGRSAYTEEDIARDAENGGDVSSLEFNLPVRDSKRAEKFVSSSTTHV